jgi:hypothetical protein
MWTYYLSIGQLSMLGMFKMLKIVSKGAGKTTYTFSANANVLSANFPFSVLPAGGGGVWWQKRKVHWR